MFHFKIISCRHSLELCYHGPNLNVFSNIIIAIFVLVNMAPSPRKRKSPKKTGKISTAYPKRKKITTFFKSDLLLNSSQDIPLQGPSTSAEPIEIQGNILSLD